MKAYGPNGQADGIENNGAGIASRRRSGLRGKGKRTLPASGVDGADCVEVVETAGESSTSGTDNRNQPDQRRRQGSCLARGCGKGNSERDTRGTIAVSNLGFRNA